MDCVDMVDFPLRCAPQECPPGVPSPCRRSNKGNQGYQGYQGLLLLNRRSGYQNTPTLLPPLFSFTSSDSHSLPLPHPAPHGNSKNKNHFLAFAILCSSSAITADQPEKHKGGKGRPRFGAAKGNRSASASSDFDRFVPGNRRHY